MSQYELSGVGKAFSRGAIVINALQGVDLSIEPGEFVALELAELRLRSFGFVFQQFNLIPTLTALENVQTKLAPAGFSRVDSRRRAEAHRRAARRDRGPRRRRSVRRSRFWIGGGA